MGSIYQNSKTDITNQKFGRLTAIKKVGVASWLFRCDCGNEIVMPYSQLKVQKSCGCMRRESKAKFAKQALKHGGSGTRLYQRYCQIKQRCYNPNNPSYHRYGGRGIEMCEEWKKSFDSFQKWAFENGYEENLSIDRIDNNGNYCPTNCHFVTAQEQALNKEDVDTFFYNGKVYSSYGFAKEFGIPTASFLRKRRESGLSPEKILAEWEKAHNLPSDLMTLEQASAVYKKTTGHIRRMIRQGKLKGEKIGYKWYVKKQQSEHQERSYL